MSAVILFPSLYSVLTGFKFLCRPLDPYPAVPVAVVIIYKAVTLGQRILLYFINSIIIKQQFIIFYSFVMIIKIHNKFTPSAVIFQGIHILLQFLKKPCHMDTVCKGMMHLNRKGHKLSAVFFI